MTNRDESHDAGPSGQCRYCRRRAKGGRNTLCHSIMEVAGAVGFEPTVHGTKNRCLTTWPRPIFTHSPLVGGFATRNLGYPEPGKRSLKRRLTDEVMSLLKRRPDLRVIAIADAAVDNWPWLKTLTPDVSLIDAWQYAEFRTMPNSAKLARFWSFQ